MSTTHKSECPVTAGQYARNQNTTNLNFRTLQLQRKVESPVIARLALAGHVVHRGECNDYTLRKYGYAHYRQDLAELTAFAIRLGVRNV